MSLKTSSIYQRALGPRFQQLHPQIQQRFGFGSADQVAAIGKGTMQTIWCGRFYAWPFLYLGAWRNIMFPCQGENIPFSIENYAYVDQFGRETVTWIRTFCFPDRQRRFDATMVFSEQHQRIVDYLGTHQHLAVDIHLAVAPNGGLQICSGAQRFYEGRLGFKFPMLFSGVAEVCEWYDEAIQKFRIEVAVRNKIWGPIFGYRGTFDVAYLPMTPDRIPTYARPVREEARP